MAYLFNPDFQDFLKELNKSQVKYVLVGGYSVIFHGFARTTGDIDILVEVSEANYTKLKSAFESFGLPMATLTKDNFLHNENLDVFTYGRAPVSIDILKRISGVEFDSVYEQAIVTSIDEIPIRVINLHHLKQNKRSSGRHKDLNDLENL